MTVGRRPNMGAPYDGRVAIAMEGVETSAGRVGSYRVLEKLGEGGMGVVYLAADPVGRKVAIKVIHSKLAGDQTALARLAREVDSMRRVHSPHVAEILDADISGDQPYVVTQFVPGRTLEQAVAEHGPLRGDALRRLCTGLAEALWAVHAAGIVHRDLKPANVMILGNGEPVVIDFGIAQGIDATHLTATGLLIGTPGYLAPEIIEGHDASPASDMHAWAGTVAFAATGRAPFGGGTFESIFYRIVQGRADLDGVPDALLPVLRSALAVMPAERPTAETLARLCGRLDMSRVSPQTRVDAAAGNGTRLLTEVKPPQPQRYEDPRSYRGVLPPAERQPRQYQRPPAQQPRRRPERPAGPKPFGVYKLLGLALLVIALGIVVMAPAIGVVVTLAGLLLLRVGDGIAQKLSLRHTRHAPGLGDVISAVFKAPFAMVGAAFRMALIAPLGLVVGFGVLFGTVALEPRWAISQSVVAGTVAFTLMECLGPGSGSPRRQLSRVWGSALPTRGPALAALAIIGLVAFFVLSFGLSQAPVLWPLNMDTGLIHELTRLKGWIVSVSGH